MVLSGRTGLSERLPGVSSNSFDDSSPDIATSAEAAAGHQDLDEARTLITALAGLVTAAAPALGHHHAAPLRDGLRSLQLAFREASEVPDPPGEGPGEKLTGPVSPTRSGR